VRFLKAGNEFSIFEGGILLNMINSICIKTWKTYFDGCVDFTNLAATQYVGARFIPQTI